MLVDSWHEWYPIFELGWGKEIEVSSEEEKRIRAAYKEFEEVQMLLHLKYYGESEPEPRIITIGKDRTGNGWK